MDGSSRMIVNSSALQAGEVRFSVRLPAPDASNIPCHAGLQKFRMLQVPARRYSNGGR